MRFISARTLLLGTVAATTMLGGQSVTTPVLAQQIALEEIVVTARKREERLQDIPMSITAFSAEDIKQAGYRNLDDILLQTSGVQFDGRSATGVGGRLNSLIKIRGVSGSSLPHLATTSLFIDGVFALGGANVLPIQELERVEVIKGPQSAFFGRNTFAGAINYITKNPSLEEFETEIDASAATYEQFDVNVNTSVPVVQNKLALGLNARLYNHGGMWTANDGGKLGEESSKSISGVIYAEPNENWDIKLRAFFQKDDDGHPAQAFWRDPFVSPTCAGRSYDGLDENFNPVTVTLGLYHCGTVPNPGEPNAPDISVNTSLMPQIFNQVRPPFDGEFGGGFGAPVASPNFLIEQFLERDPLVTGIEGVPRLDGFGVERETLRLSFNTNYEFGDGYTVTAVGGYNEVRTNWLLDFDRTDTESWWSADPQRGEDYSGEIRIVSPDEDRLRWVLGTSYTNQTFLTQGGGGLAITACFGTCALGPGNFTVAGRANQDSETVGVFGSVSYDITEQLTLDVEARYEQDDRTTGITQGSFSQDFTASFKEWTPRIILNYRPSEDTTLYAQASRGNLPGNTNNAIVICSDQAFTVPYIDPFTGQPSTASECAQIEAQVGSLFKSTPAQKLDALEVGWKQSAMDGRLRFNAAAYYYEWKNLISAVRFTYFRDADDPNQQDGVPNAFPNTIAASVPGSQELYGLELESAFAFTENWDAQLNVSWNKNTWTDFVTRSEVQIVPDPAIQFKGKAAPQYPKWLGNLTSTYRDQLNNTWDWYIRGDVSYKSKIWLENANLSQIRGYFLSNARLGFEKEDLRIEMFVLNLFDEDTWINGSRGVDFSDQGNFAFTAQGHNLSPQQKRTFGFRTNLKF
ncbi:MAG: TonB-dependent receptor [Rhodospirillaceae bacterium]